MSLELGSTYFDAGATAVDNTDGDITSSITTFNPVNVGGGGTVNTVGTYTVTYNVSDAAGNAAAQVTRTVTITSDATVPVITLLGEASVSLELGSTYTDAGATAVDNTDGDITSSIVADTSEVTVNTVGTYTVTYNVSDAAGNAAAQVTRTVTITSDATVPVITLLGEASVSLELGSTYTDAGATASDDYDGDITSSIVTVNDVDTTVVGTYRVTYNVTDAGGNAAEQVERTVNVEGKLPTSNICFPAGAPIKTDQGLVAIEKINTDFHTIDKQMIVDVTKTKTSDAFLVKFKKHALAKNYPIKDTVMSQKHKVLYNGKMCEAKSFLTTGFKKVEKVSYNGEVLYNVLLDKHGVMGVNGMVCETLHPEHVIAKLFSKKSKYSVDQREDILSYLDLCRKKNFGRRYRNVIKNC